MAGRQTGHRGRTDRPVARSRDLVQTTAATRSTGTPPWRYLRGRVAFGPGSGLQPCHARPAAVRRRPLLIFANLEMADADKGCCLAAFDIRTGNAHF